MTTIPTTPAIPPATSPPPRTMTVESDDGGPSVELDLVECFAAVRALTLSPAWATTDDEARGDQLVAMVAGWGVRNPTRKFAADLCGEVTERAKPLALAMVRDVVGEIMLGAVSLGRTRVGIA